MEYVTLAWNTIIFDPMVNVMMFIYLLIRNYGLAIIVFTLIFRLITLPFYSQQQKAMKKQQALMGSKEYKEMQKKYAKDKEKLAQEQMRMYREAGVSPLGGCLPLILTYPVLIAMWQVVTMVMASQPEQMMELSKHLYPFLPDLAAALPVNPLFLGFNLAARPDFGAPLTLVIPALSVLSAWVQQKMMTMPAADPQTAQMNQSMQMMMPLMFGFFSLQFPIGVSLYYIVFGLVQIIQQYLQGGWGNLFKNTALAAATAGTGKGKKNVANKS